MRPHASHLEASHAPRTHASPFCKLIALFALATFAMGLVSCGSMANASADFVVSSSVSSEELSEASPRTIPAAAETESIPFWGHGLSPFEDLSPDYLTDLLRKAP